MMMMMTLLGTAAAADSAAVDSAAADSAAAAGAAVASVPAAAPVRALTAEASQTVQAQQQLYHQQTETETEQYCVLPPWLLPLVIVRASPLHAQAQPIVPRASWHVKNPYHSHPPYHDHRHHHRRPLFLVVVLMPCCCCWHCRRCVSVKPSQ